MQRLWLNTNIAIKRDFKRRECPTLFFCAYGVASKVLKVYESLSALLSPLVFVAVDVPLLDVEDFVAWGLVPEALAAVVLVAAGFDAAEVVVVDSAAAGVFAEVDLLAVEVLLAALVAAAVVLVAGFEAALGVALAVGFSVVFEAALAVDFGAAFTGAFAGVFFGVWAFSAARFAASNATCSTSKSTLAESNAI